MQKILKAKKNDGLTHCKFLISDIRWSNSEGEKRHSTVCFFFHGFCDEEMKWYGGLRQGVYFWQGPMNFTFCFRQICPDVKFTISAKYFSVNNAAKNTALLCAEHLLGPNLVGQVWLGKSPSDFLEPTTLSRTRSQNPVIQKIYLKKTNMRQRCNCRWKPWQQVCASQKVKESRSRVQA